MICNGRFFLLGDDATGAEIGAGVVACVFAHLYAFEAGVDKLEASVLIVG